MREMKILRMRTEIGEQFGVSQSSLGEGRWSFRQAVQMLSILFLNIVEVEDWKEHMQHDEKIEGLQEVNICNQLF
jgi:hypothetical protein